MAQPAFNRTAATQELADILKDLAEGQRYIEAQRQKGRQFQTTIENPLGQLKALTGLLNNLRTNPNALTDDQIRAALPEYRKLRDRMRTDVSAASQGRL